MPNIKDIIAANLTAWMRSNEKLSTAKQLESVSKVGATTILRYKNGTGNPTIENLTEIARAFGRNIEELLLPAELAKAGKNSFAAKENGTPYKVADKTDPILADLAVLDKYEAEAYQAKLESMKAAIKSIEADIRSAAHKKRIQHEESNLKPDSAAQDSRSSHRRTA